MMQKKVIRTTPFGNSLTLKMAEATIKGYKMGEIILVLNRMCFYRLWVMLLPNSIEIEDTYLRLDNKI